MAAYMNRLYKIAIKQADGSVKYFKAKINTSDGVKNYQPWIYTKISDVLAKANQSTADSARVG